MRAWLFQDSRQKAKLGSKCPWSVGFYDPEGKKRSKRIGSKSMADKFRQKIEGQLANGLYQSIRSKTWAAFREEYESVVVDGGRHTPGTKLAIKIALDHFERTVKPAKVDVLTTHHIDDFKAARRFERGVKKNSTVSPATINKELRHLKAALRKAAEWGYLRTVPKFEMIREPQKIPQYVTPEHFGEIYKACDVATRPACTGYTPGDWWRALLVTAYMTGWRINELMLLRRENVDLQAGVAVLEAEETKAKKAERLPLHQSVVEHLTGLPGFSVEMFPTGGLDRKFLWAEFDRIQKAAGIHLPCHERHEHTDACHTYGFHDLRRAFATMNASLSATQLQSLMRHESYETTKRYIDIREYLTRSVEGLYVPPMERKAASG